MTEHLHPIMPEDDHVGVGHSWTPIFGVLVQTHPDGYSVPRWAWGLMNSAIPLHPEQGGWWEWVTAHADVLRAWIEGLAADAEARDTTLALRLLGAPVSPVQR